MILRPVRALLLATLLLAILGPRQLLAAPANRLEAGFANPPAETKPWCYWYWVSDNVSKQGITKDLEAMHRLGIGEALIGNIFLANQPAGSVKILSEEWWQLVEHAIREGGRVGVNIGLFNCPGWSQSGGPWVKPEQAMRYVVSSETRVAGPGRFTRKLPAPAQPFQDIAVLAFPAPQLDTDTLGAHSPRVTITPAVIGAERLTDGDLATSVQFFEVVAGTPLPQTPITLDIELPAPLTARSLQVYPTTEPFGATAELQAADEAGAFHSVRTFKCDRSNMSIGVGPMPRGPVTVSFPGITSRHFRLVFSGFFGPGTKCELAEINLSGVARVDAYIEKQLGKMNSTPLPRWDTYLWSAPAEPETTSLTVPVAAIRNLSGKISTDGTLTWEVPAGDWIILRTGMTPTGAKNSPAALEGQGLEVDKMNRQFAQQHFDAFIGQLLRRLPAADRKAFTRVVADSYEMGPENWTDGFAENFHARYGYDPKPWLPVLTGRIVGSVSQSERFLWDLRRLVADRVATEYVGGLRAAAQARGLGLWLENYGHWGFPGEFLQYGGQSDRIGGEFWVTGNLGSIECRAASSCANTYGKLFVSAESFTGGPAFRNAPGALKARGDWSFCEGINHVVLHTSIEQPTDAKVPGINAPWGTEFNRHNTWFEQGRAWVDYERRCCWLLQQGWRVADVAYFIGEDAPKMTGERNPALPPGRDFDYLNAEVIEKHLKVKNGRLALPHGVSYRLLVLPQQSTMRPELLRKIRNLVIDGAVVLGNPPSSSPSLENYPRSDEQVRKLAAELWGSTAVSPSGEHKVGKGRIIWGRTLTEIFADAQLPPDVEFRNPPQEARLLFTHRHSSEAEIYFLSNQSARVERVDCAFRDAGPGRQPELWDAVTGERRDLPEWSEQGGQTVVPLVFEPKQSWFVVFRRAETPMPNSPKNFPDHKPVATLNGAWDVQFDPKWGGPEQVRFDRLADWTTRPEESIQHYSGSALYRTTFELSESMVGTSSTDLFLDLGQVHDLATVKLNGQDLGTLWTAPWRVNITAAARAGTNSLEIAIVNPWNNRLVGDSLLPVPQRRTSLSLATITPETPLQPAGLLGPVTVQSAPTAR